MIKSKSQQMASWIFGSILLSFLIWAFILGPNDLPPQKHKILGFLAAILAGFFGYFFTGNISMKVTVPLSSAGKIIINSAGALAMFVLVLLWWGSDWSPIKKMEKKLNNIEERQKEQVTKADLVESEKRNRADLIGAVKQVCEAIEPKLIYGGQIWEQLTPELIGKAKLLLDRGNKEQRAIAEIALKNHTRADQIIQELRKDPLEDAFRLLTLEGTNWYNADEFDKAIEPFEKALALHPNDLLAGNRCALTHMQARLGGIIEHQNRAISIFQDTLKRVPPDSLDWARAQCNLAGVWSSPPLMYQTENLQKTISAYESVLRVYKRETHPLNWAAAQNNLGRAWLLVPSGKRTDNIWKAIEALHKALEVYTKENHPDKRATTLDSIGTAWQLMPTSFFPDHYHVAISVHEASLEILTKEAHPAKWAMVQNNLGNAWLGLPTEDKSANTSKAITCLQNALTVYRKDVFPMDWAKAYANLGRAWLCFPTANKSENLSKAMSAFREALTVYTKDIHPQEWARVQTQLGTIWQQMPTGNRADNLQRSISASEEALTVLTAKVCPFDWAVAQRNLGSALVDTPTSNSEEYVRKGMSYLESALSAFTKEEYPVDWAITQSNIAVACLKITSDNQLENINKAIGACEAALAILKKETNPEEMAMAQNTLAKAWYFCPMGNQARNMQKAIGLLETNLLIYRKDTYPFKWAMTQKNLAAILLDLAKCLGLPQHSLLRQSIARAKSSLSIYTAEAFPVENAAVSRMLTQMHNDYTASGDDKEISFEAIELVQ